ncbi:hypothetical protein B484DRAFT_436321, partial [Ochromonadaceae sp. CCMP2298]
MMVDCWRRLMHYWRSRRNWKAVACAYHVGWAEHKLKPKSAPLTPSKRRRSSLRTLVLRAPPTPTRVRYTDREKLVRGFVPMGLNIVERGLEGNLQTLSMSQFR